MKVRKTSKLTKAALWVVTAAAAISFVVVGAYAGRRAYLLRGGTDCSTGACAVGGDVRPFRVVLAL